MKEIDMNFDLKNMVKSQKGEEIYFYKLSKKFYF